MVNKNNEPKFELMETEATTSIDRKTSAKTDKKLKQ